MTPPEGVPSARRRDGAGWRRPRVEASSLQRYLQTLRERLGLVVAAVAITTIAAGAYLVVANKVYKAEADLLVTPVTGDDPVLSGLGLIKESNDPTRDVETAARLVTGRDVAVRVNQGLRLHKTTDELRSDVDAAPIANSNIVAITAKAGSADRARDLANGFANAVVAQRTDQLHTQLDSLIPRLRARAAGGAGGAGPGSLNDEIAQLEGLRAGKDPTLRVETRASSPGSPSSPRPILTIIAGILAGLVLGVGGAFAQHAIDPRLRREDQLRELFSLPILARVPRERRARTTSKGKRRFGLGPRRKVRRALAPGQLSPTTLEAYRTLRAMLAAGRVERRKGRSVLVTGPSPSEGKTTTAINLASSLALAGNRVILIEADFRRPTVGAALGVRPHLGIGKVLLGTVSIDEALVPTKPFGENLRVLLVDRADDRLAEVMSLPSAAMLLEEAERLADYVVIDSPPLTEVVDALPLAEQVDDVVLTVRLGYSNIAQLARLADLLESNGIGPTGFVVVGVGSSDEQSYYVREREARNFDQLLEPGDTGERERISSAEA
jgi:capsular exopolysaccharide synthesis family protein